MDLLTNRYRPKTFDDVIGQEAIIRFLRKQVKNRKVPQSQIFLGSYGSGKTTSVRIFSKAVNCLHTTNNSPCYRCKHCSDESIFYHEYDAGMAGNVEFMRDFVSQLNYTYVPDGYYEFVIFDESHLMSRQSQSQLLKVLESSLPKVRFIFCTTETNGMLETIVSRSLVLTFKDVDGDEIKKRLEEISIKEGLPVDSETLDKIIIAAKGHVRDAIKYLDFLSFGGEATDIPNYSFHAYTNLFSTIRGERKDFQDNLKFLMRFPLTFAKIAFYEFVEDLAQNLAFDNQEYILYKTFSRAELNAILKTALEGWVAEALSTSPNTVYGLMYYFYGMLAKQQTAQAADWRAKQVRKP